MADLELRGVAVSYGKRLAVAPFDERVASGQWLGVIGPNGAGKSSLLRAVAGLLAASGEVLVDGESLSTLSDRERAARVAYVAQDPLIPDDMTTFDYVLLGRTPYIGYFGSPTSHDRDVVAGVIERLRLGPFTDRLLGTMSGGERQRTVLARALAQEAPLLLLDEPVTGLDLVSQERITQVLAEEVADGRTVVVSTHSLADAAEGDHLLLLAGRVVAEGAPDDVLTEAHLRAAYGSLVMRVGDGALMVDDGSHHHDHDHEHHLR